MKVRTYDDLTEADAPAAEAEFAAAEKAAAAAESKNS